jgi:hypothetical protein
MDPAYARVLGGEPAPARGSGKLMKVNHATDAQIAAYDKFFTENEQRHLQEVKDLVAIQTLAMDPSKAGELVKATEFLKKKLTTIGMKNATVHPADGFPLVTAE